jgi:hypothetical protein
MFEHLYRQVVAQPLRFEQPGSGEAGEDSVPPCPEMGGDDSLAEIRGDAARQVHPREDCAITRSKVMLPHFARGNPFATNERFSQHAPSLLRFPPRSVRADPQLGIDRNLCNGMLALCTPFAPP